MGEGMVWTGNFWESNINLDAIKELSCCKIEGNNVSSCTDSDGGKDYYKAGYVELSDKTF